MLTLTSLFFLAYFFFYGKYKNYKYFGQIKRNFNRKLNMRYKKKKHLKFFFIFWVGARARPFYNFYFPSLIHTRVQSPTHSFFKHSLIIINSSSSTFHLYFYISSRRKTKRTGWRKIFSQTRQNWLTQEQGVEKLEMEHDEAYDGYGDDALQRPPLYRIRTTTTFYSLITEKLLYSCPLFITYATPIATQQGK